MLTPPRRRGVEILDLPGVDPEVVTRSLGDVARCNARDIGDIANDISRISQRCADLGRHEGRITRAEASHD